MTEVSQRDFDDAAEQARIYVERRAKADGGGWSTARVAPVARGPDRVVWWGGKLPLIEVPLENSRTRATSGYVLVSTDRRLPPVLEAANEGNPLTDSVRQRLAQPVAALGVEVASARIVFITSTEIYGEYRFAGREDHTLIDVSDLRALAQPGAVRVEIEAEAVFDPAIVRALWDRQIPDPPGDLPEVTLHSALPVRYQQNCDGYDSAAVCALDLNQPSTYCKPFRISGCVAVAWTMLLSAFKRHNVWGAGRAIWPSAACWSTEWPSWTSWDPSQCAAVNTTIWRVNALLGTDVNGSTLDTNTLQGAAIFREFGLPWTFSRSRRPTYEFATSITSAGQPYVWTAQGYWNPGSKAGHGVCVYGYKKVDRTILIALGWGTGSPNKWVNFDQYSGHGLFYVTGLALAADGDDEETPLAI